MQMAVRRDIMNRCDLGHSTEWSDGCCIAEAVLVADEVHYNEWY
jgi:hypothetical protein